MKHHILPIIAVVCVAISSCSAPSDGIDEVGYPDFITSNEEYYVTRIGKIPNIGPDTYRLDPAALSIPASVTIKFCHLDGPLQLLPLNLSNIRGYRKHDTSKRMAASTGTRTDHTACIGFRQCRRPDTVAMHAIGQPAARP